MSVSWTHVGLAEDDCGNRCPKGKDVDIECCWLAAWELLAGVGFQVKPSLTQVPQLRHELAVWVSNFHCPEHPEAQNLKTAGTQFAKTASQHVVIVLGAPACGLQGQT